MKSLFTLAAAVVFATSTANAQSRVAGQQQLAKGNNAFGAQLFEAYQPENQDNKLVSPYSASQALLMLATGAEGTTKTLLLQKLTGQTTSELSVLNSANAATVRFLNSIKDTDDKALVSIVNSVWLNQGFELKAAYARALATSYNAKSEVVNMNSDSAVKSINDYVALHTTDPRDSSAKPKIPELLAKGATKGAQLFLVNTTYLKAAWQAPFMEGRTSPEDFGDARLQRTRKVPMMKNTATYRYVRLSADLEAVELPLSNGDTSMVFLLQKTGNVDLLESRLSSNDTLTDYLEQLAAATPERGEVWIPKLKVESNIDLKPVLEDVGLEALFNRPNLSGIASGGLVVSSVIQKTILEMDEKGVEAAAATAIGVSRSAAPRPPAFSVKLDRPFIAILKENKFNNVLFLGSVKNPIGK